MAAVAASISSTYSLPTLLHVPKLTTLSLISPPIPIPRESNRYKTLQLHPHALTTNRSCSAPHSVEGTTSTHTSTQLHPTPRHNSTPHSDATPTQLHPTLQSHTHLQHLQSVIGEANIWVWVLICGGGA